MKSKISVREYFLSKCFSVQIVALSIWDIQTIEATSRKLNISDITNESQNNLKNQTIRPAFSERVA